MNHIKNNKFLAGRPFANMEAVRKSYGHSIEHDEETNNSDIQHLRSDFFRSQDASPSGRAQTTNKPGMR